MSPRSTRNITDATIRARQRKLGDKWQRQKPNRGQLFLRDIRAETSIWLFDSMLPGPVKIYVIGLITDKPMGENLITFCPLGGYETIRLVADLGLESTNSGLWNQYSWCQPISCSDLRWPTSR